LYFDAYRNAVTGSALYEKARTGTNIAVSGTLFDQFRKDVLNNALPQVSWLVAPEAYSEHPNWPANYGAYYVSEMLSALTANPDVWSKTVFIVVYDENDGFFDHAVPPTPPQTAAQGLSNVSITNEIYPGNDEYPSGPYGLGARVPMLILSPWSKGGWVSSEVFDHTSLIRFVEKRFGTIKTPLKDPNITAWRSAISGDLTSAFNFATPNSDVVSLPRTGSYVPTDDQRHASYLPVPPVVQALPVQESGQRLARPVPYVPNVAPTFNIAGKEVTLEFSNTGTKAAVFQVRSASLLQAPRSYTVNLNTHLSDVWTYGALALEGYNLAVYGPNGFFRAFQGGLIAGTSAIVQSALTYDSGGGSVTLTAVNKGTTTIELQVTNVYTSALSSKVLKAGATFQQSYPVDANNHWYDLLLAVVEDANFRQEIAGHVETGKDSKTDPAIPAKPSTSILG